MSERQWKTWELVKRIETGLLSVGEAAHMLGRSQRQMRRIRRRVRKRGRAALVHGNRGQRPANRLSDRERAQVVEWRRKKYLGFNDQHLTEKLVEVEGLKVSRSTVQRLLRGAGIGAVRRHRPPKHRRRRERKAQAGQMILWDGSRHDWLEGRGPVLCLMGAIDDATGELLPGAHFVEQECAAGYLRVLRAIVQTQGVPHSAYMDRHGSLKRNDDWWTLEEELRGVQDPTHVGRALDALAIEVIYALSPQAKGRVERLWGTLQDRLASELRLAQAQTLDEANALLTWFRTDFNRRFALPPAESTAAWRPVRRGLDLERLCSFGYEATVLNDNTVRMGGIVLDLPPGPGGRSYAKARVEVRQLLDGSWRVYRQDVLLATGASTAIGELRAQRKRKRSAASRAFRRGIEQWAVGSPVSLPPHFGRRRGRFAFPGDSRRRLPPGKPRRLTDTATKKRPSKGEDTIAEQIR